MYIAKALSTGQLNDKTAEAEHTDSATSDAETQSRISPLDVTSGLAMLPKVRLSLLLLTSALQCCQCHYNNNNNNYYYYYYY